MKRILPILCVALSLAAKSADSRTISGTAIAVPTVQFPDTGMACGLPATGYMMVFKVPDSAFDRMFEDGGRWYQATSKTTPITSSAITKFLSKRGGVPTDSIALSWARYVGLNKPYVASLKVDDGSGAYVVLSRPFGRDVTGVAVYLLNQQQAPVLAVERDLKDKQVLLVGIRYPSGGHVLVLHTPKVLPAEKQARFQAELKRYLADMGQFPRKEWLTFQERPQ